MLGFGNKKKKRLLEAEATLNKVLFLKNVQQMRIQQGLPDVLLPAENLVIFYAVNLAYAAYEKVVGKEGRPTSKQTAAGIVMSLSIAELGVHATGLQSTDTKSIIYQNVLVGFLTGKPAAGTELSSEERQTATHTFTLRDAVKEDRPQLLSMLRRYAWEYLIHQREADLEGIADSYKMLSRFADERLC